MLSAEEKIAIVNYRRQKSHESLNEAKEVIKLGFWSLAGNRLYYAAFHMASALLLDKGITARSHSGVIHLIGAQFVTRGCWKKNMGVCFPGCLKCANRVIMMICMMQPKKKFFRLLIRLRCLFLKWKIY